MLNFKSIRNELLFFFGLMLLLGCTVVGTAAIKSAQDVVIKSEKHRLEELSSKQCELIKAKLDKVQNIVRTMARSELFNNQSRDIADRQGFALREIEETEISNITYIDMKGNVIFSTIDVSIPEEFIDKVIEKIDRFGGPFKAGDTYVLGSASLVRSPQGENVGILMGTITVDEFTDMLATGEGSFFVLNSSGDVAAHTNKDLLHKQENLIKNPDQAAQYGEMVNIHQAMLDGETATVTYNNPNTGGETYISYQPVGTWSVAYMENASSVKARLASVKYNIILNTAIIFILGLGLVSIISRKIAKHIVNISEMIKVYAQGDFTAEADEKTLVRKDELGAAAQSMHILRDAMKEMIGSVKDSTLHMRRENDALVTLAAGVNENSQGISEATNHVADGVGNQSKDLVSISEAMDNFGRNVDEVMQAIQEMEDKAKDVSQLVTNGNESTNKLLGSVEDMSQQFAGFVDKIHVLNNSISKITEITLVINGIAEQTNLLALNASIEAARAGEAGKGFAVVAEEIRKLAEQSKGSSANIDQLIQHVTSESATIIDQTAELNEELSDQMNVMQATMKDFNEMSAHISNMISQISAVGDATVQITNEKMTIAEKIEAATAVAQEVAASTEEIAASAESARESADHVNEAASSLNDVAASVVEKIEHFKF